MTTFLGALYVLLQAIIALAVLLGIGWWAWKLWVIEEEHYVGDVWLQDYHERGNPNEMKPDPALQGSERDDADT